MQIHISAHIDRDKLENSDDPKFSELGSAPKFPRLVEVYLMLYESRKLMENWKESEANTEDVERAEYEVLWNEMLKIQRTTMGSQHSSRYDSFGFRLKMLNVLNMKFSGMRCLRFRGQLWDLNIQVDTTLLVFGCRKAGVNSKSFRANQDK
ncbi:hypothetical protein COCNU_04G009920 [Cocos nucifera]|uniref:Uncharacterized protein n=1 Tax=Cocos nucifera TaxID=13894 RepID=A0A8K0I6D9_COCNU|nr:hypothetical protein COCNU_04G009920 [Cocos nucifera]